MITGKVGVDALVEFSVTGIAHVESQIAAVIFGHFLLDDVGLNGDAEMIGLAGEIRGEVIVLVLFESVVAHVAPEHGSHAELVGFGKGAADFDDLAIGLVGTEIDGCADSGSTHVPSLLNSTEEHLIEFIGVSEQFVVIDLHDEGNLVRIFVCHGAENSERGSYGVALAFYRELDDIFRVEIVRIFGEASARGVLDALIDRKNREITRAAEAPVIEDALEIREYPDISVRGGVDAINKIGAGKMHAFFCDFRRLVSEKVFGFCAEVSFDTSCACRGCHVGLLSYSRIA